MTHIIKIFIALIALTGASFTAAAQEADATEVRVKLQGPEKTDRHELGFYVGGTIPMKDGQEGDVTVGMNLSRFWPSGIGFRAGLQYTPSVMELNDVFGAPVAFVYRTRQRSTASRIETGAYGAAATIMDGVLYGRPDRLEDALAAFLIGLISNVELYAGFTPGYIHDISSSAEGAQLTTISGQDVWELQWTQSPSYLSLSFDVGASFNYSIWRFDIKLLPAFHYYLTDNFRLHTETGNRTDGITSSDIQSIRWFFSIGGGLSFRF